MKYIIPIMICFVFSCHTTEKSDGQSVCISVVADSTDQHMVLPPADPILRSFDLDKNPNKDVLFRFKVIKDVTLVPLISYHLSRGDLAGDDPQAHNRSIQKFYSQVRSSIDAFKEAIKENRSLNNSECYAVIQQELQYLANASYDTKKLLVFSDLFEKSFLNLYTQTGLTSDKLAALFEKKDALPKRLNGIEVVFVFSPKNREEDKRFSVTVDAYKKLLSSRGASVLVQADATFFK